jgi:hypothetical protein
LNIVRTVLFAVLALALAIAPAAPCTMGRHAAAHRPMAVGMAAQMPRVELDASRRSHDGPGEAGIHAAFLGAPAAAPAEEGCPGHRHRSKHPPCPATCCALACQAALPILPWTGVPLDYRPSDRVLIIQEDGVVDTHPLRIERPPRPGA